MRTCLLVALGVLFVASAALAQFEFNDTPNATCERKDPFDDYIYHAPMIEGIVADGNPADWDQYPLIEWAQVDNYCAGTGQGAWDSGVPGEFNNPVENAEDFSTRFKAGWGMAGDWPVLYLLVEWTDDEFDFDPGAAWDETDVLQFWYSEIMYDMDTPYPGHHLSGIDNDYSMRQMNVYLVEGWGIRLYKPGVDPEGSNYCTDPKQEKSEGDYTQVTSTLAYVEAQVQMFGDYLNDVPWMVEPGYTCLAIGISGCNDYDRSKPKFSYLTWGFSNREGSGDDERIMLSTIGFERPYADLFEGMAVESSTWGAIKSTF